MSFKKINSSVPLPTSSSTGYALKERVFAYNKQAGMTIHVNKIYQDNKQKLTIPKEEFSVEVCNARATSAYCEVQKSAYIASYPSALLKAFREIGLPKKR